MNLKMTLKMNYIGLSQNNISVCLMAKVIALY